MKVDKLRTYIRKFSTLKSPKLFWHFSARKSKGENCKERFPRIWRSFLFCFSVPVPFHKKPRCVEHKKGNIIIITLSVISHRINGCIFLQEVFHFFAFAAEDKFSVQIRRQRRRRNVETRRWRMKKPIGNILQHRSFMSVRRKTKRYMYTLK